MGEQLLRNFFSLPADRAAVIKHDLELKRCPGCDGEGEIAEYITHSCDCEYCEIIDGEETGEIIECPLCSGAGEWVDKNGQKSAIAELRKFNG